MDKTLEKVRVLNYKGGHAIIKKIILSESEIWQVENGNRRSHGSRYSINDFRKYLKNPYYNADKFRLLLKKQNVKFTEKKTEDAFIFEWV